MSEWEHGKALYASVGRGGYSIHWDCAGKRQSSSTTQGYGSLKDLVTGHRHELTGCPIVDVGR